MNLQVHLTEESWNEMSISLRRYLNRVLVVFFMIYIVCGIAYFCSALLKSNSSGEVFLNFVCYILFAIGFVLYIHFRVRNKPGDMSLWARLHGIQVQNIIDGRVDIFFDFGEEKITIYLTENDVILNPDAIKCLHYNKIKNIYVSENSFSDGKTFVILRKYVTAGDYDVILQFFLKRLDPKRIKCV